MHYLERVIDVTFGQGSNNIQIAVALGMVSQQTDVPSIESSGHFNARHNFRDLNL